MKMILIEDARFAEVSELMRLESLVRASDPYLQKVTGLDEDKLKGVIDQIHRTMHFHFVRWAQSHGASCVYR